MLKMLPFDNKSEFQVVVDMPAGTPVEHTAAVLHELGAYLADRAGGDRLPGLCRHRRADQLQRPGAPVLPAQRRRGRRPAGQPGRQASAHASRATPSRRGCGPRCRRSARRYGANVKVVEVPPGPPVLSPIVAEIYGPDDDGPAQVAQARARACSTRRRASSMSTTAASPPRRAKLLLVDRRKARAARRAAGGDRRARCAPAWPARTRRYLHDAEQVPGCRSTLQLPAERQGELDAAAAAAGARRARRSWCRCRELVTRQRHRCASSAIHHKDLLPVHLRHRRRGRHDRQPAVRHVRHARRRCTRSRRRAAARSANTSSARRTTRIATTRSSGTANGRSPTRPSATWASPTRSDWC